MSTGIDYGMGQTNIDKETGIRYGVLSSHEITQAWADASEPDYGPATCGKCGNEAVEFDDDTHGAYTEGERRGEYACESCERVFDSDDAYGDEPLGWYLDDGEYEAVQNGDDCDIFIMKSPYYTKAAFCSPCAPGACYLTSPDEDGEKAYCFHHDWFDDDNPCPYPVWRVADDSVVYTPAT